MLPCVTIMGNASAPAGSPIVDGDHAVQFYAYEAQLIDGVTRFLAAGFAEGQPAVVIATEKHRRSIESALTERVAAGDGRVTMLDAATTLARLMSDGRPDPERFSAVVGGALDAAGPRARAYGEMVALLWLAGNPSAALELERLWNELGASRSFTLLCGYPTELFRGPAGADGLTEIASVHGRVAPPNARAGAA